MTTTAKMTDQADQLGLPWDFGEWMDKATLLEGIHRDVATLDWADANLARLLKARPDFRPRVLLTLLVFAYATGAYESEEIVRNCCQQETMRSICGGIPPALGEIAAFRRENRALLRWLLVELFKRALRAKFGDFLMCAGLKRRLMELAAARIDIARHLDLAA